MKREFELRIFVSLSIVAVVCALSAFVFQGRASTAVLIGAHFGADAASAGRVTYLALAAVMLLLSLLRMWAGSELSARRVMAFRVQADELHTAGPYLLVRNPIYLADLLAMCGFGLCLPWPALAMPLLFLVHYLRLIRYEEQSLGDGFRESYNRYARSVPRLFPSVQSLAAFPAALRNFRISAEGVRHNALYVLFIPGFLAAAWADDFLYAALIGIPGVLDWAIVHTKIGVHA
ncbi:MAG: methyltransferase [Bacteroidota bacterium]